MAPVIMDASEPTSEPGPEASEPSPAPATDSGASSLGLFVALGSTAVALLLA
jgi:hypothetical protein